MWEIMSRIRNLSSGSPLQAPEMTTAEIHALTGVEDGMIVYNTDTRQLLTHVAGSWLAISNSGSSGTVTNVDTGVGLTGGPITGAGTIELTETGVEAGEYTSANITVDAQGRVTAASNGSSASGVDSVVGTADQIDVNSDDPAKPIVSLADTSVNPNSYFAAAITVDRKGRITAASNSSIVANLNGTPGKINVTSIGGAAKTCTIDLVNTSVVPGEYTSANITVDAQGRVTAASNGSTASGVDSVVGTADQINVNSDDPANPIVSLVDTSVEAGEYAAANITVDAQGRIVSASSTLLPETTTPNSIVTWGANGSLLDNPNTQIDNAGNMTLSGTITASSFNSVGNLSIEESGKLRITSANQGIVQINASPDLTETSNIYFNQDLTFPSDSGEPGQILSTDGVGNLSWQSNLSSITSREGTILIDTTDPIDVDIELPETGIVAGTYANPSSITFDSYGRATNAVAGEDFSHGIIVLSSGTGSLGALLPEGVTKGKVTVIGGGGNGGNVSSTSAVATGGGSGGTTIKYVSDLSSSSSYSVGEAGAASTFTTSAVSLTASAGSNGVAATSTAVQLGGAGGGASGGDINIPGQRGDNCSTSSTVGSGKGGDSSLASGGSGVVVSGNGNAGLYGSGGSGAFKNAAGIGGIGGSGVIIIEY